MTSLTLVVAHAHRRVIGWRKRMPWHLPEDLQHFRALTWGATILMGRLTFESIGKALPGRRNLVLSRHSSWQAANVEVVGSLAEAIDRVAGQALYVVGGEQIYTLSMPQATRAVVTEIDLEVEGDAFFPELEASQWAVLETQQATSANGLPYRIVDYRRVDCTAEGPGDTTQKSE